MDKAEYIYVLNNSCFVDDTRKYGYTTNPHNRLSNANTQTPTPHWYDRLWRIDYVPERYRVIACHDDVITAILGKSKHCYNIKSYNGGGGTEFIVGDIDEVKNILIYYGYQLTSIMLEDVINSESDASVSKNQKCLDELLGLEDDTEETINDLQDITNDTLEDRVKEWNLRDYQMQIIDGACEKLTNERRIYIELATGGGKSYIVYNIFKRLSVEIIIIFSPRQIVNAQNVKATYTSILDGVSHVYDCSANNGMSFNEFYKQKGKKIIVACTQSHLKVFNYINEYDMQNVCIWFDEAHWGLEDWLNAGRNNPKKYLLEDMTRVKYRIFTSASPDRDIVKDNKSIFGELYRPIKVSELIHEGWLCPIRPFVFSEEKNDADVLYYMLEHFKEYNKNWAFSFHHSQMSAFNIFSEHYNRFKNGITNIKPFLLVSDFSIPTELIPLKEQKEFMYIKTFEATSNSIAYVVAKYSMGYDFNKIDMICFSDYKMSPKDIIQSIGRGTRPDCKGLDGRNKNKNLDVLLPIFVKEEMFDKYQRIKEVLVYLVREVEIKFNEITFKNGKRYTATGEQHKDEDNGIDAVKSQMLDILRSTMSQKSFTKLLRFHDIHSNDNYYKFKQQMSIERPELELPELVFNKFPEFKWEDTYHQSPFYTKEECLRRVKELSKTHANKIKRIVNDVQKLRYLNEIDVQIPVQSLWRFYGGNKKDYML